MTTSVLSTLVWGRPLSAPGGCALETREEDLCCMPERPPVPSAACAGVGKSSILVRFADDSFSQSFIATIGRVWPSSRDRTRTQLLELPHRQTAVGGSAARHSSREAPGWRGAALCQLLGPPASQMFSLVLSSRLAGLCALHASRRFTRRHASRRSPQDRL